MTAAAERIFDRAFTWQMDIAAFQAGMEIIAVAASRRWDSIDTVIGIGGGGIPAALGVAWRLSSRLDIVQARHNPTDAPYTAATGHVTASATGLESACLTGDVLLVDDICGTGATLDHVSRLLGDLAVHPIRIHTAVLCRNAGSPLHPDIVVWDHLREWVAFPWEAPSPLDTATRTLPRPLQAAQS